jgi:hypothetical protein
VKRKKGPPQSSPHTRESVLLFLRGKLSVASKPQARGVVHQSVDSRHGRHRVFKDLVSLGEDQVSNARRHLL